MIVLLSILSLVINNIINTIITIINNDSTIINIFMALQRWFRARQLPCGLRFGTASPHTS